MTTYIHDTFTGSDGTPLGAHTGEVGASWTWDATGTSDNMFEIRGNSLRFVSGGSTYTNESYFVSGATVAAGAGELVVEMGFTVLAADADGDRLQLWMGLGPGDPTEPVFGVFTSTAGALVALLGGYSVFYEPPGGSFTVGAEYRLKAVFDAANVSLYVDDALIGTTSVPWFDLVPATWITILADNSAPSSSTANAGITYLKIWDGVDPTSIFWTGNVGTTEA